MRMPALRALHINALSVTSPPSTLMRPQVMRRYHIQDRDDYKKYNKIVGMVTKLTSILKQLDSKDTARIEMTDQLLEK